MSLGLLRTAIERMKSDRIQNYALPGLSSSLLGQGKVRVFEACRDIGEKITPHNHRYSLTGMVLKGSVVNTTWMTWDEQRPGADPYRVTRLYPEGGVEEAQPGQYLAQSDGAAQTVPSSRSYTEGTVYHLNSSEFHSITFSRDAVVLVFEGPVEQRCSEILQPIVDGEVVPTFRVEPWMFKKGGV